MSAERIAAAACEWNEARLRALELKWARKSEACEKEEKSESDTGYRGEPPCWRDYQEPDGVLLPIDQWCEPCQRRQTIHLQYREATKHRGVLMRRLQAFMKREAS